MFESKSQAIVNTVNTVGVMGKGIALQFKKYFPNNFKIYKHACDNKTLTIGKLLVCEEEHLQIGRKIIINFPTKDHWRDPSEYSYIRLGLIELTKLIKERNLQSVSVPPLGAGNGGLQWSKVKDLIEEHLSDVDCEIVVYQPNEEVKEVLNKERAKLTPARAMMLDVLFDMVKEGEFISEFAAEKIVYFLQRFGAFDQFQLEFRNDYYGPHSGKVKHVFKYLNGSYIGEYYALTGTPFQELNLDMSTEKDVAEYLNLADNKTYKGISKKTKEFLSGFYSSFALELLSTIDYIRQTEQIYTEEGIITCLATNKTEKRTVFDNPEYITLINTHLDSFFALPRN
ncbi:O-acetyl-ADP-ribose deacetylase (regulator of RNase III) [Dysgonomonas alginatilytica]|uniref:O-acetyl-ADP-ribose deacetylase (Regulator of RNase III) n=2 Tax=Dysgonomonas alginatilytica TaxID=1605892 RepID=A0A2V3PU99_9BACT|nr:O-acetyl-ADP-ribose deacetylase (regulator of RNase III) [Dysgonomonas alginatilytica]